MKYCVGCVSSDEVIVLGEGVKKCPGCGTTNFMSQAQFDEHMSRVEAFVREQMPGESVRQEDLP